MQESGRQRRRVLAALLCCAAWGAGAASGATKRLAVREIQIKEGTAGPFLARPVAMACDQESVYVLDSGDADIKVYGRDGGFRRAIGRKGQGPAEFRLPNDLDVYRGRIYVADGANRRVQILDAAGRLVGGFGLALTPWRILALGEDRILISSLPSVRTGGGKIIRCFRADGALAWQTVDPVESGDSVLDAVRNQVFMKRAPGGGFRLVRGFDDRAIRTISADGYQTGEVAAPEDALPFKGIDVPTAPGRKKITRGFCWSSAADSGKLYLLSPEYTEDGDLGPGREIVVFGEALAVEALIRLPERVGKFAVAGQVIYAIDTDFRLRLFRFDLVPEKPPADE